MLRIISLVYYPKSNLVDVQLSNLRTYTLDAELILEKGLKEGLELENDYLLDLVLLSLSKILRQQAFNYIAIRQRTVSEMNRYLNNKLSKLIEKYRYGEIKLSKEEIVAKIIKDLLERKYLNDIEYSKSYIEQQIASLKLGKRALAYKLIQKGIDKKIVDAVLSDERIISKEKTNTLIDKSIEKIGSIIKHRKLEKQKARDILIRRLMSKGYDYQEIRNKIDDWLASEYNV